MIDTHCHLLPGVDDGPPTMAEAIALARALTAQGVETVVCTPHWSRSFPTTLGDTLAARDALLSALGREQVSLEIVLAAELSDVVAATRPIAEIRERSLHGEAVIFELLADSLIVHAAAIVSRLITAGFTPVIAHPERCRAVRDDPSVLDGLRAAGAWIQVVAPSLTGQSGASSRDAAWALLESRRADLVASDAHGVATRPCVLSEAGHLVTDRMGAELWTQLTRDSPSELVFGDAVAPSV